MVNYQEDAKEIAKFLLQIKAIILQPDNPFTWASGWKSPIYCDNRKTLSFPSIRTHIRIKLCEIIKEQYPHVNVIAGVATGGIAIGALVAEELGLPFIYVRASNKNHGKKNLIEGYYNSGQSVVVIEDLISSGKSSLAFNTIYSEGQRRYMESFSAYARSFIGNIERPDVDKINGLSPVSYTHLTLPTILLV